MAEKERQARRPVCTATQRATKIAAKQSSASTDIFAQAREFDQRAEQHEEKRAQQEGQFAVEGEHLVMRALGRSACRGFERSFAEPIGARRFIEMQTLLHGGKIREREAEDQNGDEIVALDNVDAGINQQHGGESEHVPEALLGEQREKVRPQHAGENSGGDADDEAGDEAPGDGFGSGAAAGGDIEKSGDRQDGERVAEGGFDEEGDFHFAAQMDLLQDGQEESSC